MKEITKAERDALLRQLKKQAKTLAMEATLARSRSLEEAKKYPEDYHYWLSNYSKTCYYNNHRIKPSEDYNLLNKPNVLKLVHFLPRHCSKVCANSGIIATCVATIREGNRYRFFTDEHEVGKCPHKTPQKENQNAKR